MPSILVNRALESNIIADTYSRSLDNSLLDIDSLSEGIGQAAAENLNVVYAIHTFVANIDGQISVLKGDSLVLLDDSNCYWWLIRCLKTKEVGYIPAENIEIHAERVSRMNKQRNLRLSKPTDAETEGTAPLTMSPRRNVKKTITFAPNATVFRTPIEVDEEDEEESVERNSLSDDSTLASTEDSEIDTSEDSTIIKRMQTWGSKTLKNLSSNVIAVRSRKSSGNIKNGAEIFEAARLQPVPIPGGFFTIIDDGGQKSTSTSVVTKLQDDKLGELSQSSSAADFVARPRSKSAEHRYVMEIDRNRIMTNSADSTTSSLNRGDDAIIVLKIFSGNYDFKATYKTVSVTRATKVSEVVKLALTRFKVFAPQADGLQVPPVPRPDPAYAAEESAIEDKIRDFPAHSLNSPSNYYLSVVHGDSKERKLKADDYILDVLFRLQSKSALPGVSSQSQSQLIMHMKHITRHGTISSIRTLNDREIKFLLNIRQGNDAIILPDTLVFTRVFYEDGEPNVNSTLSTYKTLAVKGSYLAKDIIELAIKKFKITTSGEVLSNFELWKSKEDLIAVVGIESEADISTLQPVDPFSPIVRDVKSIIRPDAVISNDKSVIGIIADYANELDDQSLANNELCFILRATARQSKYAAKYQVRHHSLSAGSSLTSINSQEEIDAGIPQDLAVALNVLSAKPLVSNLAVERKGDSTNSLSSTAGNVAKSGSTLPSVDNAQQSPSTTAVTSQNFVDNIQQHKRVPANQTNVDLTIPKALPPKSDSPASLDYLMALLGKPG